MMFWSTISDYLVVTTYIYDAPYLENNNVYDARLEEYFGLWNTDPFDNSIAIGNGKAEMLSLH